MRWIKASEDNPKKAGWYHTDVGLIQFDLVGDGLLGNEPPFEWMWLNRGHGMVTKWLDESIPASLEQEAERLYPYPQETYVSPDGVTKMYSNDNKCKAEGYITAARQYMDTIDKLRAENEKLTKVLELSQALARRGIFPHLPVEVVGAQMCIDIDSLITSALKTTTHG